MQVKVQIVSVRANTFTGKRGKIEQVEASCLEVQCETPFLNTFDFILPDITQLADGQKFVGKTVTLGLINCRASFGGRFRFEGSIIPTK